MITLSQAFRLCNIQNDDFVYIRHRREEPDRPFGRGHGISARTIRNYLDTSVIKVIKILPAFSYDGYEGFTFVVDGISPDDLNDLFYM